MPIAGEITETVAVPDGVSVRLDGSTLVLKGPNGTLSRAFAHPRLEISVDGTQVSIRCDRPRRQEKALIGTWRGHVRNMMVGVTSGWRCTMKVVFSHFPVKVQVKDGAVVIENFLGERHPRVAAILGDTKVEVKGDELVITGPDKEAVAQTAARVEQKTKIRRLDIRVFQDGIYLTEKAVEVA